MVANAMRSQLYPGGLDKARQACAGARTGGAALWRNRDGNVLIITALAVAVIALLLGFLVDAGTAWSYRSEAKRNLALSCERGTKPSRTLISDDTERRARMLTAFDQLSAPSPQTIVSRDAQVGWVTASITAQYRYTPPFRRLFGYDAITYNLRANCQGIPPYPRDNEVILTSAFTKPDGTDIKLAYLQTPYSPDGCWDVYPYTSIGWDEGTGPGIEIQDWSNAFCRNHYQWTGLPPANFPQRYAMELDSWSNSSISKRIELHPGRYRFSVWYNGRNNALSGSNDVNIFLQRLMPTAGPNQLIISMSQSSGTVRWQYYTYDITVYEYSLYKLTLAAGGVSDGYGGIISTFGVEYLDSL